MGCHYFRRQLYLPSPLPLLLLLFLYVFNVFLMCFSKLFGFLFFAYMICFYVLVLGVHLVA